MKKIFLMSLMALVSMTMMSCMSVNLGDGGKDTTPTQVATINETTAMQPFDEVDITGAFKVIYEQKDNYSVRVEASEQAFKEMTVYVKDRELRIRKSVAKPTAQLGNVKIYVSSPDIKMVDITGSGLFAASDAITLSNELNVDVTGSGKALLASVTCPKTVFDVTGSGNIEVGSLKADEAHADVTGSGKINLGTLNCKNLNVDITGSGDMNCDNINADTADIDISGSGDVNLKGTIKTVTKDITGSGKLHFNEE